MIFTIFIGLLFLAIVFFHYLQGFFSSAISAVLTVLAAVLAFSWHEAIVERLLQGKAANIAHSMVLVALFALIYIILRTIFDKAVPEGITLPNAIDRIGGAVMGLVAATFATGILAIAAQELPLGPSIAGYTKYDTLDSPVQLLNNSGQAQTGSNYDELHSNDAGRYVEDDRKQLFPFFPAGVDEIVVKTVDHLSGSGSMQGSQPLAAVHPDFLQELYGERAGIQGGAQHVTLDLQSQPQPAIQIGGIFTLSKVRLVDSEYGGIRHGVVTTPLKLEKSFDINIGKVGGNEITEKVQYATVANDKDNGKEMELIVVRITFGLEATDSDRLIRISPGTIRLVANRPDKDGQPFDYYPIGTLEPGKPYPLLFADKPDDSIFVASDPTGATRPGIDAVFAVDKAGVIDEAAGKKQRIADGTFIEVKRMFREDLSGKNVEKWVRSVGIESLHQPPGPPPRDKWHSDVAGSAVSTVSEPAKTEGPAPADTPAVARAIAGMHEAFEAFGQKVGGLSPEQKSRVTALENATAAKLRAKPGDAQIRDLMDDVALPQFRDILTPPQQAKFDAEREKLAAAAGEALTAAHLKLIWTAIDAYEKQHHGKLPPDLGSLAGPSVTPATFLQGDTTTAVPAELAGQDQKHQADWVNQHTDFVYKGAKRDSSVAVGSFVLAYVKHATVNTSFLRADGSVSTVDAAQAAKIIAELDTGQNPPPSLTP